MSEQQNETPLATNRCAELKQETEQQASQRRIVTRPRTDIRENESGYVLHVDMPGVDEASTEVVVEKNVLTISGKTEPFAPEGFEQVYKESDHRYYERVFRLSDDIDGHELQATVKNGVLTVTLPKTKASQKFRVPVNAG